MKSIEKDKNEKKDLFFRIMMLFMIGCFIGCVFETVLCFFQRGYFESRKGLIYGPFNAVYGFGLSVIVFVLERYKKDSSLFLAGAVLGGGIEYICSWIQETVFHTTSWDYSKYLFNFDGRTSIYHMFWWGILSLLLMRYLYPLIIKLIYKIKEEKRMLISICIMIFFIINMLISAYANIRQNERLNNVEATNLLQKIFDKYYPDDFVNRIYPNRRDAITKQKINEKNYR